MKLLHWNQIIIPFEIYFNLDSQVGSRASLIFITQESKSDISESGHQALQSFKDCRLVEMFEDSL